MKKFKVTITSHLIFENDIFLELFLKKYWNKKYDKPRYDGATYQISKNEYICIETI